MERRFQILLRFLRRSLQGFGSEKYILPDALQTNAVSFFGTPVPVAAGPAKIGNAKVIHPADVRRCCPNVRVEVHPGSTLCNDADLYAGLAEGCGWNVTGLHGFFALKASSTFPGMLE